MVIKQIENVPINSNCFVLYDKAVGNNCIIVDPGSELCGELFHFLRNETLEPEYIILTHEHFDHCWGVNTIRNRYPKVRLICTRLCSNAIQDKKKNYSVYNQQPGFIIDAADIIIDEINWQIPWNNRQIIFFSAQGHSAAGIIFFVEKYVFTGDSLIKDIKTVTKLKTASPDKLKETLSLLEEKKGSGLIVCPGHGVIFPLDGYDLRKAL